VSVQQETDRTKRAEKNIAAAAATKQSDARERKNERRKRRKEALLNKRQGNISDLTPGRDNDVRVPFASSGPLSEKPSSPPPRPPRLRSAFTRPP